jgi:pantoate--beta-alanine ligase
VVARLFRIIRPDRAYFGQKDAQQFRVIRRMVEHLSLPVQVVGLPTLREADGLAMSSRNVYLLPPDRRAALAISRALARARDMVKGGEVDSRKIRDAATMTFTAEPRAIIDYVAVVDEFTLEDLETIDRPALVLIAARVGETRLIDNTLLIPPWLEVPLHLQDIAEGL